MPGRGCGVVVVRLQTPGPGAIRCVPASLLAASSFRLVLLRAACPRGGCGLQTVAGALLHCVRARPGSG